MASQVPKQGALSIFFSFLISFGTCYMQRGQCIFCQIETTLFNNTACETREVALCCRENVFIFEG